MKRAMSNRLIPVVLDPASPPILVVTVDTEAEFDWNAPFSRESTSVRSIGNLYLAQDILQSFGVVPAYLLDYAVATSESSTRILQEFLKTGVCDIGTHLNPWLTPPFTEEISVRNSFPGNLDANTEHVKLHNLTETIAERFGIRPKVYRAGRYGLGVNTPKILAELGYQVDMSVAPYSDFSFEGGPDFSDCTPQPHWGGENAGLLEVPMTWAYSGAVSRLGPKLHRRLSGRSGSILRIPGLLSRLGLLEYVRLTPEGESLASLKSLTRRLLASGNRVFSFSYHSPSLAPGNTPYVRTDRDLKSFLSTINDYLDYFFVEVKGKTMTPLKLCKELRSFS